MGMALDAARARRIVVTVALLLLAACSGGGSSPSSGNGSSGGSSSSSSGGSAPLTNFTTVTLDAGPASLNVGPGAYTATNTPYVTITVCAPGSTSNCQTIDHVLLDTGSVGLRLEASVLNASLLSALTSQTDPGGNPVGECYEFVDDYVFGSVRMGDFSIGGESVGAMPMQVIGDPSGTFATAPQSCSSSGGSNMNTPQLLGANGLIGVGTTATDCGSTCTVAGGSSGSIYYDCPSSGCSTIIARASSTTAPFQQLPNPVAAFAVDNTGTIVSLPSVAQAGATTLTGTIYFGIGTQTNNALGSASVLPTDQYGLITANYNGTSFPNSFIDSGSTYFYWVDNSITECSQSGYTGFYCPTSTLSLSAALSGYRSGSANAPFTLYNAYSEFQTATGSAVPGVGGNPVTLGFPNPIPGSFDFGLPFFFGRNIYTAIEGRSAGGVNGPYFAF